MNRNDLTNYTNNKEWIKDRIEELTERKELLNKLTASYGLNSGESSEIEDRLAEKLVNLLDKTKEYENILKDMENKMFDIIEMLDKMENKLYRNILYKKYILGIKIEEIAVNLDKDYKYTCTLHGYALNEFDKICKNFNKVEK